MTERVRPYGYITSSYLAFHPDPDKPQGRFVQLTPDAKKRYEEKGWTFQRTTASVDYSRNGRRR